MIKKLLLITLGVSLVVGGFWAGNAQEPASLYPGTLTVASQNVQTDLSGTYTGTFNCPVLGLTGPTTLTINGNEFTTADGTSGRIVASTTGGYTAVALRVRDTATGTATTSTQTLVSLRAKKIGNRLTLSPAPGSATKCSFVPDRDFASRSRRTPAATGSDVASALPVPTESPRPTPLPSPPPPTAVSAEPMPSPAGSPPPRPSPSSRKHTTSPRPGSPYEEEKRISEKRVANDRERASEEIRTAEPSRFGDAIDQILAQMDLGNIAFNTPERMKLNSPSAIQLVVSPTETIEKLKESIVAEGEKHGEQVRISDTMQARLTGTAFQIEQITPETQAITGKEPTNWKWEVRPTQYGRHNLHLTLSAQVTLKGSPVPRAIRTFERTIEVEVSSWQRTFLLFRENWEWMWTLIAFPVLGWWLRRRHLKINGTAPLTSHTESVPLTTEGSVRQAATGDSEPSRPTKSGAAP